MYILNTYKEAKIGDVIAYDKNKQPLFKKTDDIGVEIESWIERHPHLLVDESEVLKEVVQNN